jgi:protein tyrosine/serine phosphatase
MKRDDLTREEIIEQIAEYNWDQLCEDYTFSATDLLINGCRGLNSYTDDELDEIWDRYFGGDDDDEDDAN